MDRQDELAIAEILSQRQQELEKIASLLENNLRATCDELELNHEDFRRRLVDAPRVKRVSSVIRALDEKGQLSDQIWSIDDMVGLRVIVGMQSDAELLVDCLMTDPNSPVLNTTRQDIAGEESGYRAIHIKGSYPATFANVGCEIQIRTMLQDAWAIASRYDLYHREDTPRILNEMARIEAMHLRAAETALECIREQVKAAKSPEPSMIPEAEAQGEKVQPPYESDDVENEEFVIRSPISSDRVNRFKEGYLEDRQETETLRQVFARVGAFELSRDLPAEPIGVNMFLHKGPFVEGAGWLPYFTREFAIGMERGWLKYLNDQLQMIGTEPGVSANWPDARPAIDVLSGIGKRKNSNFKPSLIVLNGAFPERWFIDLVRWAQPRWELPPTLQKLIWVEGALGDIPILCIRDSTGPPMVSLLDLYRFATLKRSLDAIEIFSIRDFDEEQAREFLLANPGMFDSTLAFEEKVRILRLRVLLNLFEHYSLEIKDPCFVLRAPIKDNAEPSG